MQDSRRGFLAAAGSTALVALAAGESATAQPAQQPVPPAAAGTIEASGIIAPQRTWDELRTEVQARTDRQVYPMTGMRSEDVRTILGRIGSLDRNAWGRSWADMAREWVSRGDRLVATDRRAAGDAYLMAWRYAGFGAWPIAISPDKKASFALSVQAFGKYGGLQEQPIERIEIPVAGSKVVVYLQLLRDPRPSPVVISIGGLDSYKEYVAERYGPVYLRNGVGWVAADAPNTGEARIPADERGERMYSAVLDYLATRRDVDGSRIGIQGVSMGGYWATKAAFAEPTRLRLAVDWAGPLDKAWSAEVLRRALGSREYLFDLPQALMTVWGYDSPEALVAGQGRMSIVAQQLVGKPTPKMLVLNGLKDTLVPADDTWLLLRTGTPKAAWLNPDGFHLGRSRDWNDERIMSEVVMPWIVQNLQ